MYETHYDMDFSDCDLRTYGIITQARIPVSTAMKIDKEYTGLENPLTLHCCLKSL